MSRSKSDDKTSRDPENLLDGFDVVFENPGSEITTNFMGYRQRISRQRKEAILITPMCASDTGCPFTFRSPPMSSSFTKGY
jgi:hypothetical protein